MKDINGLEIVVGSKVRASARGVRSGTIPTKAHQTEGEVVTVAMATHLVEVKWPNLPGFNVVDPYHLEVIPPPRPRMTEAEFVIKQKEELKPLPTELHAPLYQLAWDQGHSAGYEEVIGCLSELVSHLQAPVTALIKRVRAEAKA